MKDFFASKTLWFNFITIIIGIAQASGEQDLLDAEYLALVIGVGNVFLRFLTKTAIK